MLLQRLATGATGVKQARYRQGPTRGSEALVRACAVYTQPLALAVQCETMHGVYEFIPPRVLHFSAFITKALML